MAGVSAGFSDGFSAFGASTGFCPAFWTGCFSTFSLEMTPSSSGSEMRFFKRFLRSSNFDVSASMSAPLKMNGSSSFSSSSSWSIRS